MTATNEPKRYRKLPVEVEAMHFDGTQFYPCAPEIFAASYEEVG